MPILLKFQSGLMIVCCDAFLKNEISLNFLKGELSPIFNFYTKRWYLNVWTQRLATMLQMQICMSMFATNSNTNLHAFHNHLRFSLPGEIERRLLIGFLKTDACISCADSYLSLFGSCTFACDFHYWNDSISQLVKQFDPFYSVTISTEVFIKNSLTLLLNFTF